MIYLLNLLRLIQARDLRFTQKNRIEHLYIAIHRLRFAVGLMVAVVLTGTIGYRIIEHTSWFDAYYMSLVTLSTVGFGEVIPLSHAGRIFTSFLILFNIGFFAYAVSTATSILADRKLRAFFSDFNMMQRILKMQQHTIVCGYGRHAAEVCKELTKQKMPFVVIEMDAVKAELVRRKTDYVFLQGDATLDEILMEAGIERATSFVVTLPSDSDNLFVVLSARQINPELKIISRLNDAADELKLRRAGADHVVMPEQIGGFYMATLISKPDLMEFFSLISNLGKSQVVYEEIAVPRLKEQFRNRSIAEGGIQAVTHIPITGLRHADGHYQLNPTPDVVLQPDMHIVVIGDTEQIERFYRLVLEDKNKRG